MSSLLDEVIPEVRIGTDATKQVEKCIQLCKTKELNKDIVVTTTRNLVNFIQKLQVVVKKHCETMTHGEKIISFVDGQIKKTVLAIGKSLQSALESQEPEPIENSLTELKELLQKFLKIAKAASSSNPANSMRQSTKLNDIDGASEKTYEEPQPKENVGEQSDATGSPGVRSSRPKSQYRKGPPPPARAAPALDINNVKRSKTDDDVDTTETPPKPQPQQQKQLQQQTSPRTMVATPSTPPSQPRLSKQHEPQTARPILETRSKTDTPKNMTPEKPPRTTTEKIAEDEQTEEGDKTEYSESTVEKVKPPKPPGKPLSSSEKAKTPLNIEEVNHDNENPDTEPIQKSPKAKSAPASPKEEINQDSNPRRGNLIKKVSGKIKKIQREFSAGRVGSSNVNSNSNNASATHTSADQPEKESPSTPSATTTTTTTTATTSPSLSTSSKESAGDAQRKGRMPRSSRAVLNSLKKLTSPRAKPQHSHPQPQPVPISTATTTPTTHSQTTTPTTPTSTSTPTPPSSTATTATVTTNSVPPTTESNSPLKKSATKNAYFNFVNTIPSSCSHWIGGHSDPGKRYGNMNQDSYMACPSGSNGYIVCVCDGHGLNGEIASKIACAAFKEYFESHPIFFEPPKPNEKEKQKETEKAREKVSEEYTAKLMKESFEYAHNAIIKEYPNLTTITFEGNEFTLDNIKGLSMYKNVSQGVLLQDFGTTATVVAIKTKQQSESSGEQVEDIIVAFAGDSPVTIGREDEDLNLSPVENFIAIHNGENPSEQERVKAYGSTVSPMGVYIAPPPESGFSFAQLAVTRALGHRYFSKYGVSPDPEVPPYRLHASDRYIVVTSDGVSDVLSPEMIFEEIERWQLHYSLQEMAVKLVDLSIETWTSLNGDPQSKSDLPDNTTAVIIDLKQIPKKQQKKAKN